MTTKTTPNRRIDSLIQDFLNHRVRHLFEEHQRIAGLEARYPALADFKRAQSAAGTRLVRERLEQNPEADAHYAEVLAAIAKERNAFLAANAIDPQDLAVHYLCGRCRDTGYVGGKPCVCLRKTLTAAAFSRYDLTPRALSENFDTFRLDFYPDARVGDRPSPRENMAVVYQIIKNYCTRFDVVHQSLLFTGAPGLGKTFLSNCVAGALIAKGYRVIYTTAQHLIDLVRENLKSEQGGISRIYDGLFDCDLLIIDDLGAEYRTAFSDDQLFEIINGRMLAGQKMIISSNLGVKAIQQQYSKRLASRISGYFQIVPFWGDDIRLIKKRQSIQNNAATADCNPNLSN